MLVLEFNWKHVREVKEGGEVPAYLKEGDMDNIQITDCAKYKIELDEDNSVVDVTRLGDVEEGSGAKPNLEGQPKLGLSWRT